MKTTSVRETNQSEQNTIIAAATPQGRGALSVVRISGPAVLPILKAICRSKSGQPPEFIKNPRRANLCSVVAADGALIDTALVTFFPGPASYTGEDMAEISTHGNNLLIRQLIGSVTDRALARPAGPGEFTRRAFLNGKMDLSQAEAVKRIIEARGDYELAASRRTLSGELSRMVSRFRSAIISLKAETEAEVDFSDEDLTYETKEARVEKVRSLLAEIETILEQGRIAERLVQGVQVALAGVPNAGKSSLLNRILGWDRAIVSAVPGTTRDFVAEEFQIDGIAVRLVDTAGMRETSDEVEREGVHRTRREIRRSQIVLHVVDGSVPPYDEPDFQGHGTVIDVVNKRDILHPSREAAVSRSAELSPLVSCVTGEGLEDLRARIHSEIFAGASGTDGLLLEERQRYHFLRVAEALHKVLELWKESAPDEVTAIEVNRALEHTGEITGQITNEEILGRIFSLFCIGK